MKEPSVDLGRNSPTSLAQPEGSSCVLAKTEATSVQGYCIFSTGTCFACILFLYYFEHDFVVVVVAVVALAVMEARRMSQLQPNARSKLTNQTPWINITVIT